MLKLHFKHLKTDKQTQQIYANIKYATGNSKSGCLATQNTKMNTFREPIICRQLVLVSADKVHVIGTNKHWQITHFSQADKK